MSFIRRLSRRQALIRLGALAAAIPSSSWIAEALQTVAAQVQAQPVGYGTDPNLISPQPVPWPMTLGEVQLDTLASVAEVLCPGAVNAGVPEVLNEWLSAPYADQTRDRLLIVPGLDWLTEQDDIRTTTITLAEHADQAGTGGRVRFMARLRTLIVGAYFSSPEGEAELGYVGNRPILGPYPGTSDEAEKHLQELIASLDLAE